MIASCLPWCLLMLFTLPTLDALICAMCTMFFFFPQDHTCKWPLNENWLQYNACRVYQPSMHAQRLFWTFSPFPTLGIPTPLAIRRAQWRRTWSASGWPGNPVGTKNGDTSVGTKKWGYLWTYTYIIYQLIVIWFNFFWHFQGWKKLTLKQLELEYLVPGWVLEWSHSASRPTSAWKK